MTSEAKQANKILKDNNPNIFNLLSPRGRDIYFPKKGILNQSREATGKKINATIGIATHDNGEAMHFSEISDIVGLTPKEIYNYAPGYGIKELRELWRKEMANKNPGLKDIKTSLPVVTCGLTHALHVAGYLFAGKGERIIIPNFYWENYDLIFQNSFGAVFDSFDLFDINNGFNISGLKKKLSIEGKKIILLNFPNNPTGYSPTEEEAHLIAETIKEGAKKSEIAVIMDDAYFGLEYEEKTFKQSMFSLLADADEKILAIKIDGTSKEEFAWGLRVGFITFGGRRLGERGLEVLADKAAGIVRSTISNASNLSQNLIMRALKSEKHNNEKVNYKIILKERYEETASVLRKNKEYMQYFKALPFNSGYFMCVEILLPNIAEDIRQKLLAKFDIGTIALDNVLRIAFSSVPKNKIKDLFDSIYQACKK